MRRYPWILAGALALVLACALYLYASTPMLDGPLGAMEAAIIRAGQSVRELADPEYRANVRAAALAVEPYGDPAPFGLKMAIAEHESGFDPMARARSGAMGLYQIMPAYLADYGVDAASVWDRTANARGALGKLGDLYAEIIRTLTNADPLVWYATAYLGHAEGHPAVRLALRWLAERNQTAPTWPEVVAAFSAAYRKPRNRTSGMWTTARRVDYWESRKADLLLSVEGVS